MSNELELIKENLKMIADRHKIDADDLYQTLIGANIPINERNIQKAIKIMNYIKLRFYQGIKPARAFEIIFPDRVVPQKNPKSKPRWEAKGEKLSKKAIEIKWKRLEASQLFKKIYAQMSLSPYITFAVERFKVLGKALEIAMDDTTPTRDRFQYMKLFLDETKEPEPLKEQKEGVNININYGAEMQQVNKQLEQIASKLYSMNAREIIDTVLIENKKEDGGSDVN